MHVDEGFATATKKARKGKVEAGNLKPKKPLSKWIRFSCEQREVMMKENPQLGLMEVNKLISEKYKQISAADSERLDALAAQDKERFLFFLSMLSPSSISYEPFSIIDYQIPAGVI